MTYYYKSPVVALTAVNIPTTATGLIPIFTTNSNMGFVTYQGWVECTALAGFTSGPVIAIQNASATYNQAITMASVTAVNETELIAVGASITIPGGTIMYCNVTTAAVATTYNIRVSLWGAYR